MRTKTKRTLESFPAAWVLKMVADLESVESGTHSWRNGLGSGVSSISRKPPLCGARCRDGHNCQRRVIMGKRRCRNHGGMSTGPKTPEGRARIAEANRCRGHNREAVSTEIG